MIMGPESQAASCGYGCTVLPPSYLGSQRGDQMDDRDWEKHSVLKTLKQNRKLSRPQKKQWLKHCPVIASLNPAASPLHMTEH